MSYFIYYETDANGEPKETERRFNFSGWGCSAMAMMFPGPLDQLNHFIDLACAAPGHPVDVTHWTGEGDARRMVYSGRLIYYKGDGENRRIILAN